MGSCNSQKSSNKGNNTARNANENNLDRVGAQNAPNLSGSVVLASNQAKDRIRNSINYISNLTNQTIIKKINEVDGEMIIIENCKNCTIIVLDFSSQVAIGNCKDCNIFLGPCKSKYKNK